MRKKHPIKTFFKLLIFALIVAGLAAMPLLTADRGNNGDNASILTVTPEHKDLKQVLSYGGALETQSAVSITVPSGVKVTEYLVSEGDSVNAGDPIARVDDVSVMTAVTQVQTALDSVATSLQTARGKLETGMISVDDAGSLCVNGKKIETSKLTYYSQFINLSKKHREYEEILMDLFLLHQDGTITAPCDGIVGNLDKSQLKLLSAAGEVSFVFLADHTPAGNDEIPFYICHIGRIDWAENGTWLLRLGAEVYINDFSQLDDLDLTLTDTVNPYTPLSTLLYAYADGEWTAVEAAVGDMVLVVDGTPWIIRVGHESPDLPSDPEEPDDEPDSGDDTPEDPDNPENPDEPEQPTDPTKPTEPGSGGKPNNPGNIDWSQIQGMLGGRTGGAAAAKKEQELYSTEKTRLCTVTPMDTMTVHLNVDEMDIAALHVGMEATLTLEALPNREFTAQIQALSPFGINSGSGKFDVTLELPCSEGMLPGMNANVSILLQTHPDCLTIPVAALVEQGNQTVVYTGYDEANKQLTGPVPVEIGLSDGENAEVRSGLKDGSQIWYSYYDTLEISNAVAKASMFG